MFYHPECETESLFGALARAHENLLAVKIDGATKEEFVWGLRVGFLTYGVKHGTPAAYKALEDKTAGLIRATVSNISHASQSIVLKALKDPRFPAQQAEKVAILRARAEVCQRECRKAEYADCWDVYPFNSGYFMSVRLKGVDAEAARVHLIEHHGLGTIAIGGGDLRVAFSCLEAGQIPDVFARIAQGVRAVRGR
jgi:aspartate/methionine/tyrosine aminotransferase